MSQDPTQDTARDDATTPASDADGDATTDAVDRETLEARVAVLEEENSRLREEYRRARQAGYRRTALGFLAIGAAALAAAAILPAVRDLLVAVGSIGLFAAVITYYLTPERFIAATVGERVYEAHATTGQDLVAALGLTDDRIYTPHAGGVTLYVPQHADYTLPDDDALDDLFVVTSDDTERGVALQPTGSRLHRDLDTAGPDPAGDDPRQVAATLTDALTDQYELVDAATVDAHDDTQLTVAVTGSAYGPVTRFDHPVASLLAAGLATHLDTPITLTTQDAPSDQADYLVTCRWTTGE